MLFNYVLSVDIVAVVTNKSRREKIRIYVAQDGFAFTQLKECGHMWPRPPECVNNWTWSTLLGI